MVRLLVGARTMIVWLLLVVVALAAFAVAWEAMYLLVSGNIVALIEQLLG